MTAEQFPRRRVASPRLGGESLPGIALLCIVAAGLSQRMCPAFAEDVAARRSRPNIVVILADDLGYADVGFHGCHDIPTPHIDRLAASGVRCSSGYVSCPYCSPTRAGLLTGRYQNRFGHEFNPGGKGTGLPTSEVTIANRFKSAGYVTGLVGKWHLGSLPEQTPQRRGFDEFFGFLGGAHDYFDDRGILRGDKPADEPEYLTDAFGREAVAFIDRHAREPFLLYLAFNAVHTPLEAPKEREQRFAGLPGGKRPPMPRCSAPRTTRSGA